jgi:hypothetical protein
LLKTNAKAAAQSISFQLFLFSSLTLR